MKDLAKTILGPELEDLKRRIIENHISAKQMASGKTRASFTVTLGDNEGRLEARKAIAVLETGRKPGRVPRGFYYIILKWVADKGLRVDNPRTFAYFVSRKIAAEGTRLYRDGGRQDIFSNEIPRTIERIRVAIGNWAITELNTILDQIKQTA